MADTVSSARHVGKNIKALRLRHGLQQNELAELAKTSPANVNKWENGISTPDLESLFNVAIALKVSIERLCDRGNPDYTAALGTLSLRDQLTALLDQLHAGQLRGVIHLIQDAILERDPPGET